VRAANDKRNRRNKENRANGFAHEVEEDLVVIEVGEVVGAIAIGRFHQREE
jgi:hypothetical protein